MTHQLLRLGGISPTPLSASCRIGPGLTPSSTASVKKFVGHGARTVGTSLERGSLSNRPSRRLRMKFVLAAVTAAFLLTAQTVTADAKGCIKGALVGGAAGHMVGHGKMGAVAGCVVGHHNANKKQQQQQEQQNGSSH